MKVNQKRPLQMRNVNVTNKFKGELKALLLYKKKELDAPRTIVIHAN